MEAGIENSHLRNGAQKILNYSYALQLRVNVQRCKCRSAGNRLMHLGGDHHGIREMRPPMNYSMPHGIDLGRGSDNLGITAPRLAQQIPNNPLAGGDAE